MRKSKPILFSSVMVKAILDGNKTQTRRVLKASTEFEGPYNPAYIEAHIKSPGWKEICPHGKIGDLLWVRETHYLFGHWREVPGVRTKGGRQKWAFIPDSAECLFEAPAGCRKGKNSKDPYTPAWHKRLARFMPRAVCRTTLEITDIRVERLTDISEEDAKVEGAYDEDYFGIEAHKGREYRSAFCDLWCGINGIETWNNNTWVWVICFKVAT